jgi:hypothetical protein
MTMGVVVVTRIVRNTPEAGLERGGRFMIYVPLWFGPISYFTSTGNALLIKAVFAIHFHLSMIYGPFASPLLPRTPVT